MGALFNLQIVLNDFAGLWFEAVTDKGLVVSIVIYVVLDHRDTMYREIEYATCTRLRTADFSDTMIV
jgi:hypothetical protein